MRILSTLLLLLTLLPGTGRADTGTQLLMIRQDSCIYCRQWEAEVAPSYGTSPQGLAAPLLRIDINGPYPDGLALDRQPYVTPTFILIRNGQEMGRIEGYPGKQNFWRFLDRIMAADAPQPAG
ncbi:thioredoxin domain-containing protein [Paracoccus xiamenensis]|uniref:SoxS protein n=1 Tax=Paracoccus xiamenensis TaxID=2714901 RepID=UPI0014087F45|nr:SoxS protein [Paracoccus xiamenensis]NHF73703.1 SoxS protein [Paracoccus xiamenensis]